MNELKKKGLIEWNRNYTVSRTNSGLLAPIAHPGITACLCQSCPELLPAHHVLICQQTGNIEMSSKQRISE